MDKCLQCNTTIELLVSFLKAGVGSPLVLAGTGKSQEDNSALHSPLQPGRVAGYWERVR